MFDNLKKFIIDYSVVVFLTIFLDLFIRIGEYWYISEVKYESVTLSLFFSKSINFDSIFILLFSIVVILPLSLIAVFKLNIAKIVSRILFYLLILFLFILTAYFLINNALLSSAAFDYSLSELLQIMFAEFSMNRIGFIIAFFVLFIFSVFLFIKSNKINSIKLSRYLVFVYLFVVIVSLINRNHTFKSLPYFESYNHFLLGNSKPVFLIKTYYDNIELTAFSPQQKIKEEVIKYQNYHSSKGFYSLDFPLMNSTNYENVLGSYFEKVNQKPNVVIIISESLSATFSGSNLSIKSSLTPFTDSLASLGLSWSNFFSNAERSYGVLPNLLASLPSGTAQKGFMNMEKGATDNLRFPKHNSLIQILNNNGYKTSYFYGGAGNFDNVAEFMNQNEIDNCFTLEQFDTTKYSMDLYARSQQAWGYKDGDLYNQGLDVMDTIQEPFLSVFQTLSNHTPFNLADEKYYLEVYLEQKLASLNLNLEEVKKIDKNILSSIFYADDALKFFFDRIKDREDYKNTIFIITGDHAIDLNLADHVFENYHIPFIIYSPLLKRSAKFEVINSHIDVIPSLLSVLKQNFNLDISDTNHWVGSGLLTNQTVDSKLFIPLNINASDMPSMIINYKVLFAGDIYEFNKDLEISKVNDSSQIKNFMNQYLNYREINAEVCRNNLIID